MVTHRRAPDRTVSLRCPTPPPAPAPRPRPPPPPATAATVRRSPNPASPPGAPPSRPASGAPPRRARPPRGVARRRRGCGRSAAERHGHDAPGRRRPHAEASRGRRPLAPPDERHRRRHEVRNWTLASSGSRPSADGIGDVRGVHTRLGRELPSACGTPRAIASVMSVAALPMSICPQAMSYSRPSSEIAGQPGHRVLGRRVGRRVRARRVRGDRAVVDDAPAARLLVAHGAEGGLRARNAPVRLVSTTACHCSKARSAKRRGVAEGARVVEQEVDACERLAGPAKSAATDGGIGDVRRDTSAPGVAARRLAQRLLPAPGERDAPAVLQQRPRDDPPMPLPAPVTTATRP